MIWRCDLVPQYELYREEILESIRRVLESGRYILSTEVKSFELEFALYTGTRYAVGVANGTDALTISMMILGIKEGDEIITTPFTAIPTVSAIIDVGATPVFVDVDEQTFLMDINKVRNAITNKTKAIMPVHIFGNMVDINALKEISSGIPIIEDASQAHGSMLNGGKAGSLGDLGVFSFYPTKNLGGYGDGGIIMTNNEDYAQKAKLLRMYGMVDYNHIVINGINSRLDELQAAILRVKLKYLDEMNIKRNIIAERYKLELNANYFLHQRISGNVYSNNHVFVSRFLGDREELVKYLEKKGIQTNIYYIMPLYLQEANKYLGIKKGSFPVVEKLCDEVIALTMYPELTLDTQREVINEINYFCESYIND
ncbi:MAG: DegT/DnrJ/EryC1/StrS family aminotransferase [Bacteroidales bacterium]